MRTTLVFIALLVISIVGCAVGGPECLHARPKSSASSSPTGTGAPTGSPPGATPTGTISGTIPTGTTGSGTGGTGDQGQ